MLDRITTLDPTLKSYALLLADSALTTAERLDADRAEGKPLGPLHGVPIAIKDLLFTEGVPTASGTKVMADFKPDYTATVVSRLKEAGAVIIGKTQLTEGAFGQHHPDVDPPKNPWNMGHWPGVSSSGSGVAVAAGLAYGALGTDTGGSIRFPSASCGLVGIKPTYGRVSRYGAFALAESLDHIGPMTRTVEDAARMLGVIAGVDANDPTSLNAPVPNYVAAESEQLPGTTIGVDWDYVSTGVDDDVVAIVREGLERLASLGAEVREVTLPSEYRQLVDEWGLTCGVECARAHADYYPAQKERYGPVLANLIDIGLAVGQEKYDELERVRGVFREKFDALLSEVDLLIAPCMRSLPPSIAEMERAVDDEGERAEFITFTAPFDYSGHPTITLPAGIASNGLPKAFQLIAPHLGEPSLLRAGFAHERALGSIDHPEI
jgi:amidase